MFKVISNSCRFMCVNSETLLPFRIQVHQFTSLTRNRRILSSQYPVTVSTYAIRFSSFYLLRSIPCRKLYTSNNILIKQRQKNNMEPYQNHASVGGVYQTFPEYVNMDAAYYNFHAFGGESFFTTSKHKICREFESVGLQATDDYKITFKVLSYNVLAQCLLQSHQYLYTSCHPNALNWKNRFELIYNEVIKINPDIICFQEVQMHHVRGFFQRFENHGFKGVFKWKTGAKVDGLAIYYKTEVFAILDELTVEFFQPNFPLLTSHNVGLLLKLAPIAIQCTPIVVATTHLLYNPRRTDVRLAQVRLLLAEIDRFSFCRIEEPRERHPIILTGDLNSTPDSPVIKLLDEGFLVPGELLRQCDWVELGITDSCQHLPLFMQRTNRYPNHKLRPFKMFCREAINGDPRAYSALFNSGNIGHHLKLRPVYDRVKSNGKEEATTYQNCWVTVDYIYYSRHIALKLKERLRLPTVDECCDMGLLPNHEFGSDHLCLAATFELRRYEDDNEVSAD